MQKVLCPISENLQMSLYVLSSPDWDAAPHLGHPERLICFPGLSVSWLICGDSSVPGVIKEQLREFRSIVRCHRGWCMAPRMAITHRRYPKLVMRLILFLQIIHNSDINLFQGKLRCWFKWHKLRPSKWIPNIWFHEFELCLSDMYYRYPSYQRRLNILNCLRACII